MTNRIRICRATVTPRGFCSECKGSQKEEGINQNFCPGNNEAAPRDGQDEPWTENTILLDGNGAPTGEWTQSFVDLAGRGSVVKSANGGESVAEYNNLGQLVKTTDADGVSSLFGYDGRGQQTVTALDVDGNGQIGYGGSDRISRTRRFVTTRAGAGTVSRTETERWTRDGANAPVVVSQSDTSVTGDQSWTTSGNQTSHQQIIYGAPSDWTVTSTQPDGSKQIQTYTGGRLVSSVLQDSGGGQLGGTTYTYDAHGRVASTTDARNGTSTVTYYATDEVASTTTPAPGGGGGAQTTSIVYDAAGRQDIVTLPDGGQVDYDYYPTGSLQKVSGTRTYTVQYAYDAQGRLTTQTTNPGAAEQQTTTWAYEPGTGARGDWRIKPCRAARRPATLTPRAGAPPHGPTPGAS